MPSTWANTPFTILNLYVALLGSDNSYGTPAVFENPQSFSYTPQHDNDEIKARGANRELLSVLIGYEASLDEASLKADAVNIVTGYTESLSGTTPNQVATEDDSAGGEGKPYVGLVAVYAGTLGSRFVMGFAKGMIMNDPEFEAGQNEFRTGSIDFAFATATPSVAKIRRMRKYETASDVPDFTQAAIWDTYFSGIFS